MGGCNVNQGRNSGSRFNVLADFVEMEMDSDAANGAATSGDNNGAGSDGEESFEEMVMETQEEVEAEGNKVNVSVSHEKIAEHLRPLGKMRVEVHSQAHDGGGPVNFIFNSKALKDVTNKVDLRPTFSTASRSISKVSRAQQSKQVKILKRAGESGPPIKSPFDNSTVGRSIKTNGLGVGRPLDPPDIRMSAKDTSCPNPLNLVAASEGWDEAIRAEGV